ncbi:hypothetical protein KDX16_32140 [Burkholderia vietnamiensis]|jgi:hypothetical protein|uniref:Uncharacterized protein n=3 Tax=Burkholderia cepacia complex TaxID=87882 RepID=A0AAP4RA68_9BURK|nr:MULTISPECIES: hypothetical protein [Burkholderia]HDR9758742.1 hypothetical protein [Burkholderia cepacia ATCC 25416]MBR7920449.1 hypothetical protein [Burkholderia vietnamiensis]MBR8054811.1 hypothetical protein [Burkholderia vietnamiensis]MDN7570115.1 hypothetical protein [Burkholderia contaminans]OXI31095.1 hypothetical protein CFB84_42630 [Burkholderia aenigmatica]
MNMEVQSEVLIEAGPDNNPVPSSEAKRFVEDIRKAIEASLPSGPRKVSMMPYRYGSCELLGFDWSDGENNVFAVTFHIAEAPSLPSAELGTVSMDVGVTDVTDALLLARLIVQAVNGNTGVDL